MSVVELLRQDRPIAYAMLGERRVDILPDSRFVKAWNALVLRTGGQTGDAVAVALQTASEALTVAIAVGVGAPLPEVSGIVLDPAEPLTVEMLSASEARIQVAGHTRTGAAAALVAGATANVSRGDENGPGVTYYVYYNDPGNAGGVQTFLATADPAAASPFRVIGVIHVAANVVVFTGTIDTGIYIPPP